MAKKQTPDRKNGSTSHSTGKTAKTGKKKASAKAGAETRREPVDPEILAKRNKMIRETVGIILGLVSIFVLVCIIAPGSTGIIGNFIHITFKKWFGLAAYLLPLLVLTIGISMIFRKNTIAPHWQAILVYLLFMDAVLFAHLVTESGGIIGKIMAEQLIAVIGIAGTYLFTIGAGILLLMILTRITIHQITKEVVPVVGKAKNAGVDVFRFLSFSHEDPEERKIEQAELEEVPDLTQFAAKKDDTAPKPILFHEIDPDSRIIPAENIPDLRKAEPENPSESIQLPDSLTDSETTDDTFPKTDEISEDSSGNDNDNDNDEEDYPDSCADTGIIPGFDSISPIENDEEDTEEIDLAGMPPHPPAPGKNGNGINGKRLNGTPPSSDKPEETEGDGIDLPPFITGTPDGKPTGYEKLYSDSSDSVHEDNHFHYELPPVSLLRGVEKEAEEKSAQDYSKLLEETLANFGVEVKVINKIRGPAVTRYELQPARGVKVKKVTSLANDIALSLAAYSIRIEAPIPGRSAIGIEVPNHRIDPVSLRDILVEGNYRKQARIMLALGKDITGKPVMDNLLKMPHLLIAGSTGSGKSVCINCLITSILYTCTPLEVQMIMVDPKRVELSLFEGIPHLVDIRLPGGKKIITDPKAATLALKTVCDIMDQRYEDFVEMKVRNINEYNKKAEIPLPYIVVVIDELADLMMVSSQAVEQYICRIAQLGRASGIHLLVATQRPSVDVITGLIKANIPSRIAFAVSSQVDSRTILDRAGAEKLLGKGDMLYQPVDANEPRRIQGAYVSSEETEKIVDFWRMQPPPDNAIPIEITGDLDKRGRVVEGGTPFEENEEKDPLIPEAIEIIRQTRQASVSNLQRKMKIGYARAGRIMDQLEHMGVVGPADGSKPRKINLPGFDL